MRIFRPIDINNSNLQVIGAGTEYGYPDWVAAYNPATTYALGDKVVVLSPSSTVTIPYSSPFDTVYWTAHELTVGMAVAFTSTGTLPAGEAFGSETIGNIVSGKAYFIYSVTANSFKLSKKLGGVVMPIIGAPTGTVTCTVSTHKVYESLQAANTAHTPRLAASVTWWQDLGNSNHWKQFDGTLTSQTTDYYIYNTIALDRPVDTLAVLNIDAAQLFVTVTDTVEGIVYDQEHSLISTSGIDSWWAFFFYPIERLSSFLITDIPPISSGTITTILQNPSPSQIALCGAMFMGMSINVGGTEYDASVGIQDFSVIEQNAFGDYAITERAFNKTASFTVVVAKNRVAAIFDLLVSLRATPALYIGSEIYMPTVIYGFPDDWAVIVEHEEVSVLNISIKGLT